MVKDSPKPVPTKTSPAVIRKPLPTPRRANKRSSQMPTPPPLTTAKPSATRLSRRLPSSTKAKPPPPKSQLFTPAATPETVDDTKVAPAVREDDIVKPQELSLTPILVMTDWDTPNTRC
jgi:hypothetical protein